jgi:hypothetical protein
VDRGDPFGLLGYDCRWLKLERVRQGFFRGRFWIPVRKSRTKRLTEISTSTSANTHRSVKHSFNSCLPQDVILKYTQYFTPMVVDRRFCTVSKGQWAKWNDNTNPGSQRLALLMSMLPIIQPHQLLSLSKVLFMQDRATRCGTAVYRMLRQLVRRPCRS